MMQQLRRGCAHFKLLTVSLKLMKTVLSECLCICEEATDYQ